MEGHQIQLAELSEHPIEKDGAQAKRVGEVVLRQRALECVSVRQPDETEPLAQFRGQEVDGPPVVPPPRTGFGLLMIEKALGGFFSVGRRRSIASR
jgi:hypothetical protein